MNYAHCCQLEMSIATNGLNSAFNKNEKLLDRCIIFVLQRKNVHLSVFFIVSNRKFIKK